MSGSVDIIGIDNVVALLEKYDVIRMKVTCGTKDIKFDESIGDDYTRDDMIAEFVEDVASNIPPTNYKKYKLEIVYKNKSFKNCSISYDFCFNTNTSNVSYWDKKENAKPSSADLGFTSQMYIEAATNRIILADENRRLKEELEEISAENEELERKIPNGEQPQNIGSVLQSALYSNADKIIAILADKLFGGANNPSINLAGIPDQDINSMLNQMMLIEPEFPSHLSMLINLRKNKPDIYSMAVAQLKSL